MENQIKMAKMVLMNELNKQANRLIEELEVCTDWWTRWMGSVLSLGQKPGPHKLGPALRATWAEIQMCSIHSSRLLPVSYYVQSDLGRVAH